MKSKDKSAVGINRASTICIFVILCTLTAAI